MVPVVLSIAGTDPSGGAGLFADMKTFHACGVYGAGVVSAITVQNTLGVRRVEAVSPALVAAQLAAVLDDLPVAALKTGLLTTAAQVDAIAACLDAYPQIPLVIDPVLTAGSGDPLGASDVADAIATRLLPHAVVITPNLDEAARLTQRDVRDLAGMHRAAEELVARGAAAVLVKGGHLPGEPCDVLRIGRTTREFRGARLGTARRHGTGCTLSAALTARLAHGDTLDVAVENARGFVRAALASEVTPGRGARPLDHLVRGS